MSREIRRVPPDWQHPRERMSRYVRGVPQMVEDFKPMHDEDYDAALTRWLDELAAWRAGGYASACEKYAEYREMGVIAAFAEYHGEPPTSDVYRPAWNAEQATAYQMYETVSEGTPISPVCGTAEEMVDWLMTATADIDGHERQPMSRKGAEAFVADGWAPSGVMTSQHGWETGEQFVDRTANEEGVR